MGGGDSLRYVLGMERSAPCVDVAAIGLDVQEVGGNPASAKYQRSDGAGRSVGAIDQHAQVAEIGGSDEACQPLRILFPQLSVARQHVCRRSHSVRCAFRQLLEMGKDVGFNLVFEFVGQLVTVGAKDLDAVVLPGIVRRGNDNAGGEVIAPG